jgi:signal transduction histidine kinase
MMEELSLHVLDIGMNALAAGARTVRILVVESKDKDRLVLEMGDDGCGMDAATLRDVLDRSSTSKQSRRKNIGLGLALLRQTAEACAGDFCVSSQPGKGTTVTARMQLSHVDLPPLGDLNSTILALCAAAPGVDVRLTYQTDNETFEFSSQELATAVT